MLRETLNEHIWPNLFQKRESREDDLAPCSLVSWKAPVDSTAPFGRLFQWLIVLMKMKNEKCLSYVFPFKMSWPLYLSAAGLFSPWFSFCCHWTCRGFSCSLSHPPAAGGFGFPNPISVWLNLCILPRSTFLSFYLLYTSFLCGGFFQEHPFHPFRLPATFAWVPACGNRQFWGIDEVIFEN